MWAWIVAHKHEIEIVGACWLAVQVAAGMPTPNGSGPTSTWWYRWAFNVAHSITNLPRLLATTFPQVSWIAMLFGVKQESANSAPGGVNGAPSVDGKSSLGDQSPESAK
jgi:hypothetical protein